MTNFHDNKDWNIERNECLTTSSTLYDQLPWQQGLKHCPNKVHTDHLQLYDQLPWQQGLKQKGKARGGTGIVCLYDQLPWQQGLKLCSRTMAYIMSQSFMTNFHDNKDWNSAGERQSKELISNFMTNFHDNKDWNFDLDESEDLLQISLWPTSMTTRIETLNRTARTLSTCSALWPTSMTTRIETQIHPNQPPVNAGLYDQLPWQQGLKLNE